MITTIEYDGPIFSGVAPEGPYELSIAPMPHPNRMGTVITALGAAHPGASFEATPGGVSVTPKPEMSARVLPKSVAISIGGAIGTRFRIISTEDQPALSSN